MALITDGVKARRRVNNCCKSRVHRPPNEQNRKKRPFTHLKQTKRISNDENPSGPAREPINMQCLTTGGNTSTTIGYCRYRGSYFVEWTATLVSDEDQLNIITPPPGLHLGEPNLYRSNSDDFLALEHDVGGRKVHTWLPTKSPLKPYLQDHESIEVRKILLGRVDDYPIRAFSHRTVINGELVFLATWGVRNISRARLKRLSAECNAYFKSYSGLENLLTIQIMPTWVRITEIREKEYALLVYFYTLFSTKFPSLAKRDRKDYIALKVILDSKLQENE